MTKSDGRTFASAFDDMLDQSRKEFDALLSGAGAAPSARPRASNLATTSNPKQTVDTALQLYGQTESARRLDQRFGDGWRCEVAERQREGDEMIALCKLHVPAQGIVRSQFGVARLSEMPGRDEDAAYYAAVSEAMQACADSLLLNTAP